MLLHIVKRVSIGRFVEIYLEWLNYLEGFQVWMLAKMQSRVPDMNLWPPCKQRVNVRQWTCRRDVTRDDMIKSVANYLTRIYSQTYLLYGAWLEGDTFQFVLNHVCVRLLRNTVIFPCEQSSYHLRKFQEK